MTLMQLAQRQPQLAVMTLLLLVLGAVASVLHGYLAQAQTERQLARYGQALADGGAVRAVEPALAQDMVSLQVILQSLTRQPGVAGATIHDVENHLWVQSGTPSAEARRRFTAPIALDTHIAGYLTLSLDSPKNTHLPLFLWVWWSVLALALAGLWWRSWRLEHRPAAEAEDAVEEAAVDVRLSILNIPALQQHLSQDHLTERLARLDRQLSGVLALYDGCRDRLEDRALTLRVSGDTTAQATFYALCICQLLTLLNSETGSPRLQLAAQVIPVQSQQLSAQALAESATPPLSPGTIMVAAALREPALAQRVQLDAQGRLQSIKAPYQELLVRQQRQLAQL